MGGPLGSIAELPALSCHEIKLSEGKDTISKMCWMDPTGIGKAELLHCDMKLEGKRVKQKQNQFTLSFLSRIPSFSAQGISPC